MISDKRGGVAITTFIIWIAGFILGLICITFSVSLGFLVWIIGAVAGFLVLVTEGETSKKITLHHTQVVNPPTSITQTTHVDSQKKVVVKCGSCGAYNDEDSTFCKKCGKSI